MLRRSPRGAFLAVDPPAWMQADLRQAEVRTPLHRMKTLVLHADDLPMYQELAGSQILGINPSESTRHAREVGLDALIKQAFGKPLFYSRFASDLAVATEACSDTDSRYKKPAHAADPGEQAVDEGVIERGKPHYGVILLPARRRDARQMLSEMTGIAYGQVSAEVTADQLLRMKLGHELGHQWRELCLTTRASSERDDERLCDVFSIRTAHRAGDPGVATLLRDVRALYSLVSDCGKGARKYWNVLALHNRSMTPEADLAAQFEVKARAIGLADVLLKGQPSLMQLSSGGLGEFISQKYQFAPNPATLLRELARADRTHPYLLPVSRQLAHHTLGAADRIAPALLTR